jgi:hypothetical protein
MIIKMRMIFLTMRLRVTSSCCFSSISRRISILRTFSVLEESGEELLKESVSLERAYTKSLKVSMEDGGMIFSKK